MDRQTYLFIVCFIYTNTVITFTDLHTDEEFLDECRRELRKVSRGGYGSVQDVHISCDACELLFQPDIADHEHQLHAVRHAV